HNSVVSEQPLQTAAAQPAPAQPQAPAPAAESDGAGLQMVSSSAAPAPAPANNGFDMQAAGQAASAIQSGNLGQAASALNSLFGSQGGSQQQAAAPQVQFQPLNTTVTVKKGALIRGEPVFNAAAVATTSQNTKLQATGKTGNNLWWQVLLP